MQTYKHPSADEDMNLEEYLQQKYRPKTVREYKRYIKDYLQYSINPLSASYKDILKYIEHLRKKYSNPVSIENALMSIKQYYEYLLKTGKREDHPCRYLTIKDNITKPIQIQELLTPEELKLLPELVNNDTTQKILKNRNKVIIGLLIYQALKSSEIVRLEIKDIDFDNTRIYVKGTSLSNSRIILLNTKQILPLYQYISKDRAELLKTETNKLIITLWGTPIKEDEIRYLIERFKPLFPQKTINPLIIRQSVIANLLKQGKDLRLVQHFAGHKYPTTTEKYRQTGIEELKAGIEKYHPLK